MFPPSNETLRYLTYALALLLSKDTKHELVLNRIIKIINYPVHHHGRSDR